MRTKTIARMRKAALASMLAASLGARAQNAQPEAQSAPAENAPIHAQPPRPAKPPRPPESGEQPKPVPGAPPEYTIEKGDTLWDLSQRFLSNPWYWPKIWSLNPEIENPHWIYPGNKLRITPGEGGAAQVEGEKETPALAPDAAVTTGTPQSPDLAVVHDNHELAGNDIVKVTGKLGFTPPPVVTARPSGVVPPEEMENAGRIEASFEEKQMLAQFDTAYVRFKGEAPVRPGDKLVVFRPDGEVIDPQTHKKLADKTQTCGVVKVLSVQGSQATVQVESTELEMERGDLVRAWTPQEKRVVPRPNAADVSGYIVGDVNRTLAEFGEQNVVYIDRGTADGVQEGNTFAVVRRGDGLSETLVTKGGGYSAGATGEESASVVVPEENVGLLLVTNAGEHVSTALVVKSVRELIPGDLVQMHAAPGTAPAAAAPGGAP